MLIQCSRSIVASWSLRFTEASSALQHGAPGVHHRCKGICVASIRRVDVRYSLEGYATLTGVRSRWLPDWTLLQPSSTEHRVLHHRRKGSCVASIRSVDVRYSLEGYATLTGVRSRWLPDWTLLEPSSTEGGCCTIGAKGFAWQASAPWTLDWKPHRRSSH